MIVAPLVFLWWASGPGIGSLESEFPVDPATARPLPVEAPEHLRVVSFNVAYGRGPENDIGDLRSGTEVRDYLDNIAAFIKNCGADIAALQEVDFNANRSHFIDEAAYLAGKSGLEYCARITTWQNNYIPYPYWPPSQQYGRTHSGQCVLSRFPLERNVRYVLPQPRANPWFYNLFYLHRSIQRVDALLGGGRRLRIFNVHLEAFDVPNKMEQARMLVARVRKEGTRSALILGDFNCVPPEATLKRGFPDEPETDLRGDETMDILRELKGYSDAIEATGADRAEAEFFTFPAEAPNRRLDYLFFSEAGLTPRTARVAREAGAISDHLPVIAEFSWTGSSESEPYSGAEPMPANGGDL